MFVAVSKGFICPMGGERCEQICVSSFQAQNHFKMMKEANMRASEKMLETRYFAQNLSDTH